MKTINRYEIRSYNGNEYSKPMSAKLRTRQQATKLVRRLRKMGHDAFAAPMKVAA